PPEEQEQGAVEWEGKATVTFSDAITAVRRWLWTRWVFPRAGHGQTFAKLPESVVVARVGPVGAGEGGGSGVAGDIDVAGGGRRDAPAVVVIAAAHEGGPN